MTFPPPVSLLVKMKNSSRRGLFPVCENQFCRRKPRRKAAPEICQESCERRKPFSAIFLKRILFLMLPGMLFTPLNALGDVSEDSRGVTVPERDGAFLDLSIGIESAFGGLDPDSGKSIPSVPSLFLKVGGGYAVLDWLEIGASFSLGAVGSRCMGAVSDKGACIESAEDWSGVSGDFTMASLTADAAWRYALTPLLKLKITASAGWVFLDPEPRSGLSSGFAIGAGAGVLWRTPLDHFSIGIAAAWSFVPQASLHALSLTPQIRYTF